MIDNMTVGNEMHGMVMKYFGYEFYNCPACRVHGVQMDHIIAHLNDHHKWSIERIADWLEEL